MGTVTFSDVGNMGSPTIWYGSVYYADDNEIWLYNGTYGAIYTGYNFTYSNGALVGGTLTGYIQARNISTDYYGNVTGYTEMYRGEGFSIPAATAYYYIQTAKDALGFIEYTMSGGDIIKGSAARLKRESKRRARIDPELIHADFVIHPEMNFNSSPTSGFFEQARRSGEKTAQILLPDLKVAMSAK